MSAGPQWEARIYSVNRFFVDNAGHWTPIDWSGELKIKFQNSDPVAPRENQVWMRGDL